jgi:hypothetical protein
MVPPVIPGFGLGHDLLAEQGNNTDCKHCFSCQFQTTQHRKSPSINKNSYWVPTAHICAVEVFGCDELNFNSASQEL